MEVMEAARKAREAEARAKVKQTVQVEAEESMDRMKEEERTIRLRQQEVRWMLQRAWGAGGGRGWAGELRFVLRVGVASSGP